HSNIKLHTVCDMTPIHILLLFLSCTLFVHQCNGACAEPDSDTEAGVGQGFKLGCISCKRRSEVKASATVEWYFKAKGEVDFVQIYTFSEMGPTIENEHFMDRLDWNGSKRSNDIQDAKVVYLTVVDKGRCRNVVLCAYHHENSFFPPHLRDIICLTSPCAATRGTASIVSEVMMYVSIIGLQVWLLIEMIYCYRKIAAAGEEALREAANAEYLAIASESKDNCAGAQVGE
uniref:Sodium channel regulatory subunit beta-3 n=1 Tax=Hippocampus comes TaxID=109280 RepID=A0A3Q2YY86_HIPCM